MKLVHYASLDALQRDAVRWDDLWERSEATLPTARVELLAHWIAHFAARRRFAALAVEDGGQLIAALPLVGRGGAASHLLGSLPGNCWSSGGELLLDPAVEPDSACGFLVDGLRRLPWSIILADNIDAESLRWRTLLRALDARGLRAVTRPQFPVGLIDIGDNWDAYEASWSGNHRRALRKSLRKLEAAAPVELKRYHDLSPAEASRWLRALCEIEDKSWKGSNGASILRTPGMLDFFDEQARRLAVRGQVEFLFLEHAGRPIAGDYGYRAKGVFHSHKIAYDPDFAHAGPGQVLRWLQLRQYFRHSDYRLLDTLGVLSEANAKWATRSYRVSRVLFSTRPLIGNGLVQTYAHVWPTMKKLLRREETIKTADHLGAESYAPESSGERKKAPADGVASDENTRQAAMVGSAGP